MEPPHPQRPDPNGKPVNRRVALPEKYRQARNLRAGYEVLIGDQDIDEAHWVEIDKVVTILGVGHAITCIYLAGGTIQAVPATTQILSRRPGWEP